MLTISELEEIMWTIVWEGKSVRKHSLDSGFWENIINVEKNIVLKNSSAVTFKISKRLF